MYMFMMKSYTIQLPCIELLAPDEIFHNRDTLKEYSLSHWKDEILRRLIVECPTVNATSNTSKRSTHPSSSYRYTPPPNHDEIKIDATPTNHTTQHSHPPLTMPTLTPHSVKKTQIKGGSIASPNHSLPKKLDLLNTIARVQRQFFHSESPKVIFGTLLDAVLDLLDSEYGFIGEVKVNETDGSQYLQTHTITNIAWDSTTRKFYDDNIGNGLAFTNMNSLFGAVVTSASPVISNEPKTDKRGCGVPKGHPPLDHFLGVPFFMPGGEMNGMVGISNKPGGYNEDDIEFLEPFTVTCGNLINAFNQIHENKHLINTLEDSVRKRTHEFEQANLELEEANRQVLQANKLQLQHFACMSHEIRTPLNCVIGMASVLQQSKLSSMQNEAVEMIVNSGDLLLAIINDVLDYSKYETENVNVNLQRSSLQDTITLVLNSIASKALPAQSVRSFFDAVIPEQIYTDSRRLQQILFNLLGNAIKFSPDDGTITLRIQMISHQSNGDDTKLTEVAKQTVPNELMVERTHSGATRRVLRFIVEDNGKGIDESDLKRIFQPFQQASSTAENVYGGTGLGLSITQKIVTALGGTINVASKKSEWSKFTVDIPCEDSPVIVKDISHQVKNYILHIVGFHGTEKVRAEYLLQTFDMDGYFFTTLGDMLDVFQSMTLEPEQTHVCLLHEDCYEDDKAKFLSQSITITFGQKFGVDEDKVAYHFRSLEHLLPSHFINHLIRSVWSKKEQKGMQLEDSVIGQDTNIMTKSYTELRVLIAEDNIVNQKVLTRILNQLNVKTVDIVENGLEACKREEEVVYDLIFMDQQMPIMGGVAACRRILERYNIKNSQNQQRPTIVFATAQVSADCEMECSDAGGSGFVPKPFNLDVIEQCLRTVYKLRLKAARKVQR